MPTFPTGNDPIRADLDAAEAYLRALDLPADAWLWRDVQQFYRIGELAGRVFGQEAAALRNLCETGALPFAVMLNERAGWRVDRNGLIWYIAQQRRGAAARAEERRAADESA